MSTEKAASLFDPPLPETFPITQAQVVAWVEATKMIMKCLGVDLAGGPTSPESPEGAPPNARHERRRRVWVTGVTRSP